MNLNYRLIRILLLIIIASNIIMGGIAFFMYPPLKTIPYSYGYILSFELILFLYAIIIWRIIGINQIKIEKIVRLGLAFGIIEATIEIFHIAAENYAQLPPHFESIFTGIIMLLLVILFLISGYCGGKISGRISFAIITGTWGTIICMLLVCTFGLSELFWGYNAIKHHDIGSPDYFRTGWTDFDAFVIADILMACIKVLFIWPFIGAFFALIGGCIAKLQIKLIRR